MTPETHAPDPVDTPSANPDDKTPTPPAPAPMKPAWKIAIGLVAGAAIAMVATLSWFALKPVELGPGFISGNGRIEATEIDISTKLPGRILDIFVSEGDFVKKDQLLAQMQTNVLGAQRDVALAQSLQAVTAVSGARAQVAVRQGDSVAAEALVTQRNSDLLAAQQSFARTEPLAMSGAISPQALDNERARLRSAAAAVAAALAQLAASHAAVKASQAQVLGAGAAVAATEATVGRVDADIQDSQLKAPRDGRVQYRIAQPGEVLPGGGKVLNLVDLSDVYLTFFLPETVTGKLALGSEVHVVLDSAPQYVIPAAISYVASTAQFTPKTVETKSERQKLMFRVKAQFSVELLRKHLSVVKTGLPGIAWVKLDPKAKWPPQLETKVPQ